jgi:hypothetical protein
VQLGADASRRGSRISAFKPDENGRQPSVTFAGPAAAAKDKFARQRASAGFTGIRRRLLRIRASRS